VNGSGKLSTRLITPAATFTAQIQESDSYPSLILGTERDKMLGSEL